MTDLTQNDVLHVDSWAVQIDGSVGTLRPLVHTRPFWCHLYVGFTDWPVDGEIWPNVAWAKSLHIFRRPWKTHTDVNETSLFTAVALVWKRIFPCCVEGSICFSQVFDLTDQFLHCWRMLGHYNNEGALLPRRYSLHYLYHSPLHSWGQKAWYDLPSTLTLLSMPCHETVLSRGSRRRNDSLTVSAHREVSFEGKYLRTYWYLPLRSVQINMLPEDVSAIFQFPSQSRRVWGPPLSLGLQWFKMIKL